MPSKNLDRPVAFVVQAYRHKDTDSTSHRLEGLNNATAFQQRNHFSTTERSHSPDDVSNQHSHLALTEFGRLLHLCSTVDPTNTSMSVSRSGNPLYPYVRVPFVNMDYMEMAVSVCLRVSLLFPYVEISVT